MVNKALNFNTSPAYIFVPMAEKLLREIERQRQAYQQLWENYQWYKKNVGSQVCDCQELGDNNQQKEPKSTALRKLGVVHCTPFDSGDYYLCEVCGTHWISWEPGVGYGGGWQLADKYEDLLPPKTA